MIYPEVKVGDIIEVSYWKFAPSRGEVVCRTLDMIQLRLESGHILYIRNRQNENTARVVKRIHPLVLLAEQADDADH